MKVREMKATQALFDETIKSYTETISKDLQNLEQKKIID